MLDCFLWRLKNVSEVVRLFHGSAIENAFLRVLVVCMLPYIAFLPGGLRKVPQNGETNTKFGVYKNVCCGVQIVLVEGAEFPDCPNHPKLTTEWKSISDEPILRANDLPSAKKKSSDFAAWPILFSGKELQEAADAIRVVRRLPAIQRHQELEDPFTTSRGMGAKGISQGL